MHRKKTKIRLFLLLCFIIGTLTFAFAKGSFLNSFNSLYGTTGTALDTCELCHPGGNTKQYTVYADAYLLNGKDFTAIENIDSDGDGFNNLEEIQALTFPGDPGSFPTSSSDTKPPQVQSFVVPTEYNNLTVPIEEFTADDNVGVTGYFITSTANAPYPDGAGWSPSPPVSFTFASKGSYTLYAWAKDAAGNVSNPLSASTTISLPDNTAPTVDSFSLPPSSNSLNVTGISVSAHDDTGVTGYTLTESAAKPSAGSGAWTAAPPSSYAFTTEGTHTLYAWAKDAAGNVSSPLSDSVSIVLTPTEDNEAPQITSFEMPQSSNSLTVQITSFTATDNVGVTGYLVTNSLISSALEEWSASPPSSFTFSAEGSQTLYALAKDAAGNISTQASATTNITLNVPDPDTGSMWIWDSSWFEIQIRENGKNAARNDAYLEIIHWDDQGKVFQAALHTQDPQTRQWQRWELPLHYTSGDPLRFLGWFEFAGEYHFSFSINGRLIKEQLSGASIRAAGVRHQDTVAMDQADSLDQDGSLDDGSYNEGSIPDDMNQSANQKGKKKDENQEQMTISGSLVDISQLSEEVLAY